MLDAERACRNPAARSTTARGRNRRVGRRASRARGVARARRARHHRERRAPERGPRNQSRARPQRRHSAPGGPSDGEFVRSFVPVGDAFARADDSCGRIGRRRARVGRASACAALRRSALSPCILRRNQKRAPPLVRHDIVRQSRESGATSPKADRGSPRRQPLKRQRAGAAISRDTGSLVSHALHADRLRPATLQCSPSRSRSRRALLQGCAARGRAATLPCLPARPESPRSRRSATRAVAEHDRRAILLGQAHRSRV